MAWKLDDNRPVYLQIIEQMMRRIIAGQYGPGDKLPSVRELAMEAAVNPNTMQRAMADLEREGLIFAERTNGRFVTEDKQVILDIKTTLAREIVEEFLDKMKELGFTTGEIIKLISGEEEV